MIARSELANTLKACRKAFVAIGVLSGLINVLSLNGSIYMLAVYDRVLLSGSVPSLIGLSILALAAYAFYAVLEVLRMRLLTRIGGTLNEVISPRLFDVILRRHAAMQPAEGSQPLRDLDAVRSFLNSPGPSAMFDVPWIPLYLFVCFAFHWWIGVTVLVGAAVMIVVTMFSESMTRQASTDTSKLSIQRFGLVDSVRRAAPAIRAMGMTGSITQMYARLDNELTDKNLVLTDTASGLSTISRTLRMVLQSAVLGVGALLVIRQEASPGVMIASSILAARALAPVDVVVAQWRGFVNAREGWTRLRELLRVIPPEKPVMPLRPPRDRLSVEGVTVAPPGTQRLVLRDVSFTVKAGSGVGVIGPSASGKTTLGRCIVGLWAPQRGAVRLDGAALEHWSSDQLGRHVGYLPQDVELIEGTIAENISRFDPNATSEAVIEAATSAGVDAMINGLPEGYETRINEAGTSLSAGQAQRVALARALYGNPFLVVLDEPNSNLDAEGEQALTRAIESVRARGGVAVVIAHRPSALAAVDQVLVLQNGAVAGFGPRDEILKRVLSRPAGEPADGAVKKMNRPDRVEAAKAG